MTSETDSEFLDRMNMVLLTGSQWPLEDWNRLFALARRGAAMQWRPISEHTPEIGNVIFCGVDTVCEGWRSEDRFYAADGERIDNVRYWMPLPPAPEGETER